MGQNVILLGIFGYLAVCTLCIHAS